MVPISPARVNDHLVEFYETEAFLTVTVCGFLAPALRAGDAAIVVATGAHRRAFEKALTEAGIAVEAAASEGRYIVLDASGLLLRFVVDGRPDPARFREVVSEIVDRASLSGRRRVRIYSEMVALLWARGNVQGTLALEDLWNDLAKIRRFLLMCAYPMRSFEGEASGAAFRRICEQHRLVIPSEGYSLLSDPAERASAVAQLQQERAALHAEVLCLRAEQEAFAESAYVDSVTGLGNRRAFDMHLEREWALTLRDGIDSYVVVAEIDAGQRLGGGDGPPPPDDVLVALASALRTAARRSDIIARIGRDTFGVLLLRCDERAAPSFMARLQEVVAERTWPGHVDVSLGQASLQASMSAGKSLDRAGHAMAASRRAHYAC